MHVEKLKGDEEDDGEHFQANDLRDTTRLNIAIVVYRIQYYDFRMLVGTS